MFNAMMDGIKEESVGALFNLQVEVQQNPVTDEAGVEGDGQSVVAGGIQMSAGPQVTATPQAVSSSPLSDPQADASDATTATGTGGNGTDSGRGAGSRAGRGGRPATARSGASRSSGGRHRSTGGTGPQPVVDEDVAGAPGLPAGLTPRRAGALQYTAPSVDGGTHVESHVEGVAADGDFARVGRNDPCPCGSGRKFKRCHGDPRNREAL
jgi:preprotein translocase subunit SecA